jgi:protein-tyrosine phosphatase
MKAETKNFTIFALMGFGWFVAAARTTSFVWLLIWAGVSCLVVASAYGGLGAGALGKRPNGSLAWWAIVLLLPYFVLTTLLWHTVRLMECQQCCHEVAPGWWLGRRPLGNDLPPHTSLVVDLTSEFAECHAVLHGREYISAPALDHSVPAEECLEQIATAVDQASGSVYFHCAQGHGRSAMVVAALLVRRGDVADGDAAIRLLQTIRPGVRLTSSQCDWLDRVTAK